MSNGRTRGLILLQQDRHVLSKLVIPADDNLLKLIENRIYREDIHGRGLSRKRQSKSQSRRRQEAERVRTSRALLAR